MIYRWHCPKTSPIWGSIHYSSGTAQQRYPPRLIKSATVPTHTTSQQAELINSYTSFDPSQKQKDKHLHWLQICLYHINEHYNIIIWKERRWLTQTGTSILSASFISELLHVAQFPKQAAVIHCQRHQRHSPISFYNNITDHKTKQHAASVSPVFTIAQIG